MIKHVPKNVFKNRNKGRKSPNKFLFKQKIKVEKNKGEEVKRKKGKEVKTWNGKKVKRGKLWETRQNFFF